MVRMDTEDDLSKADSLTLSPVSRLSFVHLCQSFVAEPPGERREIRSHVDSVGAPGG